jgi:hypothetical protein
MSMPKLSRLTLLISAAISATGLLLTVALVALTRPEDRLWVVVVVPLLTAAIVVVFLIISRGSGGEKKRAVPPGHAAIIETSDDEEPRIVVGPAEAKFAPPREKIGVHKLSQKPLDLTFECMSRDHFMSSISLTVFWEARVDSLVDIVKSKVDVPDLLRRLVQAHLNLHCYRIKNAADIPLQIMPMSNQIKDDLNQPRFSGKIYAVNDVLITQIRLPPEITSAAVRLKEAECESAIADSKRATQARNQTEQATAQAVGLTIVDQAYRTMGDRSAEMERNRQNAPKPNPEV